jgi:hypothetical protein
MAFAALWNARDRYTGAPSRMSSSAIRDSAYCGVIALLIGTGT